MELFLFLILLLFIAIVDSLLIAYINSKFNKNFALLHKEKEEIENNYKLLRQEILNLQQQLKEQETLLQEKKLAHEKQLQQQEEIEKNITDPVTYIRQKNWFLKPKLKEQKNMCAKQQPISPSWMPSYSWVSWMKKNLPLSKTYRKGRVNSLVYLLILLGAISFWLVGYVYVKNKTNF